MYNSVLIVLIELVIAVGAFVKDGGALVHATNLHGVEEQLGMEALGAGLLDGSVFAHDLVLLVCVNPRRTRRWCRLSHHLSC